MTVAWTIAAVAIVAVIIGAAAAMSSKLRRNNSADFPPPAWSGFLSREEFDVFISHVVRSAEAEGLAIEIGNGLLSIRSNVSTAVQLTLIHLVDRCHHRPMSEWDSILREELLRCSVAPQSEVPDISNFEQCRHLLGIQLGLPQGLARSEVVGREDIPDVVTYLILDMPHGARTISPAEAARWDKTSEELFALAISQTRQTCKPTTESIELGDGGRAFLMTCENPFVAAWLFSLRESPELTGAMGAIIAVPTQHILISYPIKDPRTEALLPLAWTAARRFQDGPGSITPRLYWYFKGRFQTIEYELTGHVFRCEPPMELAGMLGQ